MKMDIVLMKLFCYIIILHGLIKITCRQVIITYVNNHKQIMMGIVDNIRTLTMFCESLENRARTMSNEMIKIDMLVSSALELRPDIDRVARAENFIEDGKLDVRRD